MGKLHPNMVRVYLNDQPMHVPRKVKGHYAVRGWLGIARGWCVTLETRPREGLVFADGHEFYQDERYVTTNGVHLFTENGLSDVNQGKAGPEEREPSGDLSLSEWIMKKIRLDRLTKQ